MDSRAQDVNQTHQQPTAAMNDCDGPLAQGPTVPAPGNPAPWQDYQTVFTNAKAGMEGVDKEHVQRIVYEMSKDSAHFRNEQCKAAQVAAKIEKLKARSEALTAAELTVAARSLEQRIAFLESSRDLTRTWLHADMDCFYAAVHELERPELKDVPMAVGGIGMISTANYQARKYGIRSAMPGFIAKRLCPQLVFVPVDFPRYTAAAERVRAVFRQLDPDFESGGLDEAFLDVTEYCQRTGCTGEGAAAELRRRVREVCGLTCSCGVAPNKMLAKICSDINKPDGQYVLPPSRAVIMSFMETLPTRKIPCIGKVTEQLLRGVLGVATCGQLLGPARARLPLLFSETAAGFFLEAALGLAATRHAPKTDTSLEPGRKGISCERTFRNMRAPAAQEAMARQLVESLAADMAAEELEGRNITLKLKLSTFEVRTRAVTLPRHVHRAEELLPPVLRLLRAEMPVELRLMGVRMAALRKVNTAGRSPLARLLGLRPKRTTPTNSNAPSPAAPTSAGTAAPAPAPGSHPHQQQQLHSLPAQLHWRPVSAPVAGCAAGGETLAAAAGAAQRTTEPGHSPPRYRPLPPLPAAAAPVAYGSSAGGGGGSDLTLPALRPPWPPPPQHHPQQWATSPEALTPHGGRGAAVTVGEAGVSHWEGGGEYDEAEYAVRLGDGGSDGAGSDVECLDPGEPLELELNLEPDPNEVDVDDDVGICNNDDTLERNPVREAPQPGSIRFDPWFTHDHIWSAPERQPSEGTPRAVKRQRLEKDMAASSARAEGATGGGAARSGRGAAQTSSGAVQAAAWTPAAAAPAAQASGGTGVALTAAATATAATATAATWSCRVCTFAGNRRQVLRCEVCDSLRGSSEPPPQPDATRSGLGPGQGQGPQHRRPAQHHSHGLQQKQQQQLQRLRAGAAPGGRAKPGVGAHGGLQLERLWATAAAAGAPALGPGAGAVVRRGSVGRSEAWAGMSESGETAGGRPGGGQQRAANAGGGEGGAGGGSGHQRQCPQCGSAVAASSWLEHQDWHLAVRLSREGTGPA